MRRVFIIEPDGILKACTTKVRIKRASSRAIIIASVYSRRVDLRFRSTFLVNNYCLLGIVCNLKMGNVLNHNHVKYKNDCPGWQLIFAGRYGISNRLYFLCECCYAVSGYRSRAIVIGPCSVNFICRQTWTRKNFRKKSLPIRQDRDSCFVALITETGKIWEKSGDRKAGKEGSRKKQIISVNCIFNMVGSMDSFPLGFSIFFSIFFKILCF